MFCSPTGNTSSDAQNIRQLVKLGDIFRAALMQVDETRPLNLRCSMCLNQRTVTNFRTIDDMMKHFQTKHNMQAVFMSQ